MINLLSAETKRDIRAARLNAVLARYACLVFGAIVFMAVVFGVGYVITSNNRAAAQSELEQRNQEASGYAKTQQEAADFAKNLSIAKTILSNEIVYSSLLTNLASNLPKEVILNDFTVDNAALNGGRPIVLNAQAKSYGAALQLKSSLEASSIFEQVNLATIEKKPNAPGQPDPPYPFIVQVNVTIPKGALGGKQ